MAKTYLFKKRERERESKRRYTCCTNEHTRGNENSKNDIFITHTTPVKNKECSKVYFCEVYL